MNDYHDKYMAESNGGTTKSYETWLIGKLENAETNIYALLSLQKQTEHQYHSVVKCAREFINAIRKANNKLAHYKMLELETYLEEYERKKRTVRV